MQFSVAQSDAQRAKSEGEMSLGVGGSKSLVKESTLHQPIDHAAATTRLPRTAYKKPPK